MPEILTVAYAGQPLWLWLAFLGLIIGLLWVDLGLLNRKDAVVSPAKSAVMWACFASLAVAFGAYIYFFYEPDPAFYNEPENLNVQAAMQFATGYLLETALAFDNIFVIGLVFTFFAVPREYQHRVLFWGVLVQSSKGQQRVEMKCGEGMLPCPLNRFTHLRPLAFW